MVNIKRYICIVYCIIVIFPGIALPPSAASMDDSRLRRCATSASSPSGATRSSSSIRMRSSGRLWAARQLLTIVRARRRSFRELVGSISVAPAVPTWVREYSGRVRTVGTMAEPDRAPAAGFFALARSSVLGMSRHLPRPRQPRLAGSPGGEPHAFMATAVPSCPPGTTTFRPQPLRILSPTRDLPWNR